MESNLKTHILIIEDEALIADHLAACLESDGYVVEGILDNAEDALHFLQTHSPDLILLDIQLSGTLDGVDLAQAIQSGPKIPVVFITSNTDARTLARVKLTNPAGFIVKPFQPADLRPAIELALYARKTQQNAQAVRPEEDSFFLKDRHEMFRVYYADILYAEAADNYTQLHLPDRKFMLSQTLKTVEEKLSGHGFFRIHRSYLVNISKINCIRPTEVVIDSQTLPASANARSELLKYVQMF